MVPAFLPPMLAVLGDAPFDSPDHLFEWKWDGFRALVSRTSDGLGIRSRRDRDLRPRFPDLDFLEALPEGCLVDGEIVALEDGKPSFELLLRRERTRSESQVGRLAQTSPVIFVAFDLLFDREQRVTSETLLERRERLRPIMESLAHPRGLFSEGLVGPGKKLFEDAVSRELEGVVAKRTSSRYHSGKRSDDWIKIKRSQTVLCVILGFLRDETGGLKSLVVAAEVDGTLTCVGRVGSGFTEELRRTLLPVLEARIRTTPIVPTDLDGVWIEPGLFCRVSYVEKTGAGMLRAPVFRGLIEP
ncbi:MAG: hypothetical protein H6682_21535 [Candidatus Eisenbacteria bacterium]|nr:hypothetical protein [Candidatus Eisenbacteria bacterium]